MRYAKIYLGATSILFAIWVSLAMYMGLEHNSMGEFCDYGAPKKWEYYTSQGGPCRPRHFVILKHVVVFTAVILLPVQTPAYVYFVAKAIIRRRGIQSSNFL